MVGVKRFCHHNQLSRFDDFAPHEREFSEENEKNTTQRFTSIERSSFLSVYFYLGRHSVD